LRLYSAILLSQTSARRVAGSRREGFPRTGRFRLMHGVGFVRFRKARPSTSMLKLAARGRDSACPEYAWGFWRRVTFLLTSTSGAGVAERTSDTSSPTSAESRPRCFRRETGIRSTLPGGGLPDQAQCPHALAPSRRRISPRIIRQVSSQT